MVKIKLLILNTSANTSSPGRIGEEIGLLAQQSGFEVRFAYGRKEVNSRLSLMRIGDEWDIRRHGLESRLFDTHGFASRNATKEFIRELELWKPDIINIHNVHGYYINVELLFNYLKHVQMPVVWTFHDCWPFTGHCSYFDFVGCYKWKTECNHCPNLKGYPASWGFDNSKNNYYRKNELFNGLEHLTIVTPSQWLANHVKESFLKEYPVRVINNGVDEEVFNIVPKPAILGENSHGKEKIIMGIASIWDKRKGLDDFMELRNQLPPEFKIVLVGLSQSQIRNLPKNITGISRTESTHELAALYSAADVFVNPTYVDNFPTPNIEALACGTPVITYNTGGSPEAIDESTGIVVDKGDVHGLKLAIEEVLGKGKNYYRESCRARAERLYNKDDRFRDYIELFKEIMG